MLPFWVSFLLPYFDFLSSEKFIDDPFQPSRNVLYDGTKIYNSIRLAGIGNYHIGELGYNEKNPINLLGLILSVSIVIVPVAILYKDKYRQKLRQINYEDPGKLDFLLIVIGLLLAAVTIIELGRNGILWQIPLGSLLRNPIKPNMLAVSLGFLVSYVLFLISLFLS